MVIKTVEDRKMDNTIYASYLIPESRLEGLTKHIEKLAKRIAKGKTIADFAPEIQATREAVMVRDKGTFALFNPNTIYSKKAQFFSYNWVTLLYQQPKLNGWNLVCAYDWETSPAGDTVCYVSTVPGQMVPIQYREVESGHCDHCHHNRRRVKSFLLTKDFIEYKVVGSSCLKDFLGHHSPKSLLDVFSFELYLRDSNNEAHISNNMAINPVEEILSIGCMMIRKYGFVRSGDYDKTPTSSLVFNYMFGHGKYADDFRFENVIEEQDEIKARKVIEWVKVQPATSDYMSNVIKAVNAGAVREKRIPLLVGVIAGYNKAIGAQVQYNKKVNEWIGAVGDKLENLSGSVTKVHLIDGNFGLVTKITLLLDQGNTVTWFASGSHDVEVGEKWVFKGTVKKLNEYNGWKDTVLTRVKYTVNIQQQAA
jgi:hypothetical protein